MIVFTSWVVRASIVAAFLTIAIRFPGAAAETRVNEPGWIGLTGHVVEAEADGSAFKLESALGEVSVELDADSGAARGSNVRIGQNIVVLGRIDGDLFQSRTLKAAAIRDREASSTVYARPEADRAWSLVFGGDADAPADPEATNVVIVGAIQRVDPQRQLLFVEAGLDEIRVDTSLAVGNPVRRPDIEVGTLVRISGVAHEDFIGRHEIEARRVIPLPSPRAQGDPP